jgi:hypothetical protein
MPSEHPKPASGSAVQRVSTITVDTVDLVASALQKHAMLFDRKMTVSTCFSPEVAENVVTRLHASGYEAFISVVHSCDTIMRRGTDSQGHDLKIDSLFVSESGVELTLIAQGPGRSWLETIEFGSDQATKSWRFRQIRMEGLAIE